MDLPYAKVVMASTAKNETVSLCMTQQSDLGLLRTTLVLLDEQHVTRAAERLCLSTSATSRALDRSRVVFGDPLLVKQGRNVVITPRGEALREQIRPLLRELEALFVPDSFDPAKLRQTFVLRAGEAVLASAGSQILAQTAAEAPNVHIRFENEATDDFDALRSGVASLAIGSYSNLPPDISSKHLVDEHLVGVVRGGHHCLKRNMTVRRFAALDQLVVSRRGIAHGPVDRLLAEHDLTRHVAAVVPSFAAALAMAAQSDLVAILPSRFANVFTRAAGLQQFAIPLELPTVDVCQIWHHRLANDPAHQWLRSCILRASGSF
jgi:DNA-binding transcriptional LysR family regulator